MRCQGICAALLLTSILIRRLRIIIIRSSILPSAMDACLMWTTIYLHIFNILKIFPILIYSMITIFIFILDIHILIFEYSIVIYYNNYCDWYSIILIYRSRCSCWHIDIPIYLYYNILHIIVPILYFYLGTYNLCCIYK